METLDRQRTVQSLSGQQLECLRLVARGLRSKEIAQQLGLSAHTVDGHLRKAIARLGVPGRLEAARLLDGLEDGAQRLSAQPLSIDVPTAPVDEDPVETVPTRVQEERQLFGQFPTLPPHRPDRPPSFRRLGALHTVALIAILFAAAAVALSCAYPLGVGAQHLADWLSPRDDH